MRGAHLFQFGIVNSRARQSQFQAIFAVVQQSLRAGEGVLFHSLCREGPASGLRLTRQRRRLARRGPSRPGRSGGRTRRWPTELALQSGASLPAVPLPTKYLATSACHLHVAAEGEIPLCAHKQKGDKARRLRSPFMATDKYEAFAWERPKCAACFNLAPLPFGSDDPEAYENVVAFALRAL